MMTIAHQERTFVICRLKQMGGKRYKRGEEEECRVGRIWGFFWQKRMASNRGGHRASKSFHASRTSVAVLPMAPPFSPAMDSNRIHDYSPKVRFCRRVNSASVLGQKGPGFESREPTSPKVSCIGQIKMKPQWVKEAKADKASKADKAAKNAEKSSSSNRFSRVKNFMFGKRHGKENRDNKTGAEEVADYKTGVKKQGPGSEDFPSLGKVKRYSSARYDYKFGDLFVEEEPGSGKSDGKGVSAINVW